MSQLLERKSVLKVKEYLEYIDKSIKLIVLEESARTAVDAANSLKKDVGSIVKSLVFKSTESNNYYLCLVSGDKFADINKISKRINTKIKKANADQCKAFTGYSIGGVSPVAHNNKPTKILIDENLNRFDVVYAAAGHPYVVFGINYKQLCGITEGIISDITDINT